MNIAQHYCGDQFVDEFGEVVVC